MNILFVNPITGYASNMLYQWDQGISLTLSLDGLSDSTSAEAVFAVSSMRIDGVRRSLVKDDEGLWHCTVPDVVLTYGPDVIIYFTDTTDGRRTVGQATISIIPQAKPEGYISTDDPEYVSLNELMDKVLGLGGSMMTKEEIDRIFE